MIDLPKGWKVTTLGELCHYVRGVTYNKTQSSTIEQENYLPILRANNIQNGQVISDELVFVDSAMIKQNQRLQQNDIIVAMSSGSKSVVGKTAFIPNDLDCAFGAFCGVLRPIKGVNPKLVYFFTQSNEYRNTISQLSAGANINNLKPAHFKEIQFPLPPLAEQTQIATLLDHHLSKVAIIRQKLNDILPIIKQFRQSVLFQAVSGKLLEGLDFENWQKVQLSDISQIKGGKRLPKGHELLSQKTPYPYIRVTDFDDGSVNLEGLKYLDKETHHLIKNYTISKHDLYISIAGTIGLVGDIPEILDGANLTENSAKICDIKPTVNKDFLKICLNSHQVKEQFYDKITSSGQPKLALFRIRECEILLPPPAEQHQIVSEVERLFALADTIENQVNQALDNINHMTQSLLHQAFIGNLTKEWRIKHDKK